MNLTTQLSVYMSSVLQHHSNEMDFPRSEWLKPISFQLILISTNVPVLRNGVRQANEKSWNMEDVLNLEELAPFNDHTYSHNANDRWSWNLKIEMGILFKMSGLELPRL